MSRAYEVKDDPSGKTIPKIKRSALLHRGECPTCGYAPWDAEGHGLDARCPALDDDLANQIGGTGA